MSYHGGLRVVRADALDVIIVLLRDISEIFHEEAVHIETIARVIWSTLEGWRSRKALGKENRPSLCGYSLSANMRVENVPCDIPCIDHWHYS